MKKPLYANDIPRYCTPAIKEQNKKRAQASQLAALSVKPYSNLPTSLSTSVGLSYSRS